MQADIFETTRTKPILKWAGGKQQILSEIRKRAPKSFNKYIEPFVGGGAVFFAINSDSYVISDTNPELINLYRVLPDNVDEVIQELEEHKNEEDYYYDVRAMNVDKLTKVERAARFVYLNRTCFNGLYRVNKKGEFNVPFGKYKNPRIIYEKRLRKASEKLRNTKILLSDYKDTLNEYAEEDDFIFLDPPYIPISEYSNFKRYTKEQFRIENHKELADTVKKLAEKGCKIILTNSNHELVYDLYSDYKIEVLETNRNISKDGDNRKGQDTIISINV